MDGISSTPIENSVQFLRLRDKYKSNLLDDSRLTKAAGLAAQKELLLESPAPDTWKEPRLKSVNRELQQWVKKIRQPGGTRGISRDEDDSDDDDQNLAVGPLQHFMGNIAKISKAIKRKAEPTTPQSALQTPVIKQSPSTGKKPKLTFKTGSKAKRLLPKTPKKTPSSGYKTPKKKKTPSPPSSVFSTADEDVPAKSPWQKTQESIEKKFAEAAKRAQERALKKLAPGPGWKPFGTPAKRKLDGKDW